MITLTTSGSQYFRFPHFKNHKRGGQWVNLIHVPKKCDVKFDVDELMTKIEVKILKARASDPKLILPAAASLQKRASFSTPKAGSPSEVDWHEAINRLHSGEDAEDIIADLQPRTIERGKHHSYARRTVENAEKWIRKGLTQTS